MEKFKFASTEEDLEKTTRIEKIVDDKKETKKKKDNKKTSEPKEKKVEEKEVKVSDKQVKKPEINIEAYRVNKKPYFGFKSRVVFFFALALILFAVGCQFLVEAVNKTKSDTVYYDEISNISYKVCMDNATHYQEECQGEERAYITNVTNTVNANFKYDVKISEPIDYNIKYYIEAKTSIYDKEDNTKLLYSSAENLVDNTPVSGNGTTISMSEDLKIPYKKYNDFVQSYKSKYSINTNAKLDVTFYLVEDGKSRKISSLTMNLGNQTFTINRENTTNIEKEVDLENNSWGEYNTVCFVIGIILLLGSLFIILKLANFVNKVVNTKSKYQKILQTILREYDRIIVETKDGYVVPEDKVVLELDSFNELVDARDTLGKPIIYERINEVKSQFYVEDDNKVYKYTLKESDVEDN